LVEDIGKFMQSVGLGQDQFYYLLLTQINYDVRDVTEIQITNEDFNNYKDSTDSNEEATFIDFIRLIREMTIFSN